MNDLQQFIASIKQFITGTANNLKTILDKKFKGSGLIEVTTETIRATGDIEVKLKNIPKETIIGNPSGTTASPTSFEIEGALKFSDGKLRTEVGELSDIENSTTEQKSWSGATLKEYVQPKIGFARYRMTYSPKYTGPSIFDETIFIEGLSTSLTTDNERVKIPENGYYEIVAVLNSYNQHLKGQAQTLEIFKGLRSDLLSGNTGDVVSNNISASTGVIYLEQNDEIGIYIMTGNSSESHKADLSIKKIG